MIVDMEKRIRELTALVNGREQESRQLRTSLGRQIHEKFRKEISSGPLADAVQPVERLLREIPEIQKLKQSILKKMEREEAIKEITEQLKMEKKSVADQLKSFHVEIGKLSFLHYKDSSESDFEMEAVFRELSKTEEKIRDIDNELYMTGSGGEQGFFSNLLQKGKALFLSARRKSLTLSMANLYRKCGEQICSTTLFEELAETDFADLAAPYRENKAKLDRIEEEDTRLRNELKELREDMKKICEGKTTRRRITELDNQTAEKSRELDAAFGDLGGRFAADTTSVPGATSEQRELVERIARLEDSNARDRMEISLLEARIAIEKMEQTITKKTARIEQLDREINQKKQEIKDLKKEITGLEKDIATQQAYLEEHGETVKLMTEEKPLSDDPDDEDGEE